MVVAHGEAHHPAGGFRQIDVNVVGPVASVFSMRR
jgi:hypothetical protein